jgi:hypothetical protein
MTTLAGAIEIQMLADLARLKKDMDAAKGMVGDAAREMQRYADLVKGALGGIAAGLTIGAFKQMVTDSIDAADALHDLAIQTGVTVEGLSAMAEVGRTTGTTAEAIGGAINKMAKNLAVANEESKGAAQAIKALGLDFNTFKQLQGDQQLLALAQAMGKFEDGGGKSAAAMTLMGREGARLLPFMKALAGAGELVATVTTDQAAMADRYNDSVEGTRMRVDALKREMAMGLLPTLIDVHDLTGDLGRSFSDYLAGGAKTAGSQLDVMALTIGGLGTVMEALLVVGANVAFVFRGVGTEIGGIAAQAVLLASGNLAGAAEVRRQMVRDAQDNRAALDDFERRVLGATDRALQARSVLRGGGVSSADQARELARINEAAGRASGGQLKFSADSDAAAASVKRHADEVQKLFEKLGVRSAQQQAELAQGRQVSAAEKEALELMIKLRDGTLSLTDAQQVRLRQQLELINSQEKHLAIQKSEAQLQADMQKDRDQIAADIGADTLRLREQVASQRDQNLALQLGALAFADLQAARLRSRADELESIATTSEMSDELRAQAALLRDRAGLLQESAGLSAATTKPLVSDTYTGVRDALAAAFRDSKNPIKAFADALGNAVFTRVTSNLADALATQLVGSSGTGGLFGSLLGSIGGFFTGGVPVGNGTGATGDFARFDRLATPLATGMDYVPHDNFRALLHKGERVVPAAEAASAGRSSVTYAPATTINVDARADRAAVVQEVQQIVADGNARQMAELHRLGVLA